MRVDGACRQAAGMPAMLAACFVLGRLAMWSRHCWPQPACPKLPVQAGCFCGREHPTSLGRPHACLCRQPARGKAAHSCLMPRHSRLGGQGGRGGTLGCLPPKHFQTPSCMSWAGRKENGRREGGTAHSLISLPSAACWPARNLAIYTIVEDREDTMPGGAETWDWTGGSPCLWGLCPMTGWAFPGWWAGEVGRETPWGMNPGRG